MSYYDFFKEETDDGSFAYIFCSDASFIYTISFDIALYTSYLDRFPYLLNNGYGLGLFPNEADTKRDDKIAETVIAIIKDFLSNDTTAFLLYHCDYNDGKQRIRHRLFSIWHAKFKHGNEIYKYSLEVEITNTTDQTDTHYIGFLCRDDNETKANAIDELEQFSVDLVGTGVNKGNPF